MQTNSDKVRTFRNEDKEPRLDRKRDKMSPKELRKQARRVKHVGRDIED